MKSKELCMNLHNIIIKHGIIRKEGGRACAVVWSSFFMRATTSVTEVDIKQSFAPNSTVTTFGFSAVHCGAIASSWSIRQPGWPSCDVQLDGTLSGPLVLLPTVVTLIPHCTSACAMAMRYAEASSRHPLLRNGRTPVPEPQVMLSPSGSQRMTGMDGGVDVSVALKP